MGDRDITTALDLLADDGKQDDARYGDIPLSG